MITNEKIDAYNEAAVSILNSSTRNSKSNVNKRARELEQKEIENSELSKKISDRRGQSVVSGFFLLILASDPHQIQTTKKNKFFSLVLEHAPTDTCCLEAEKLSLELNILLQVTHNQCNPHGSEIDFLLLIRSRKVLQDRKF